MINLLPAEEKQKLFLKKKEKLAMILEIVVLVFLVCLILVLLSIKFYILTEVDYQKNILEQTKKENQTPDFVNSNDIIQKYNGILAQLSSFYEKEIYFSQALKIISDVPTPKDFYFTNFYIKRVKNGNVQVNISGTSGTRDDLLVFKKNIEERPNGYPEIKKSSFSPESWINPQNANFSLTLEIY